MGILLQSLGLEALGADTTGDYSAKVTPPVRSDGSGLSLTTVVGLPAVFRSYQILYGTGGRVPFHSWRGTSLTPRQPQVITQPDPWRNRRSWTVRYITGMVSDGNGFLRKMPDPLNAGPDPYATPIAAPVLNPFAVAIRRDKSGRKVYDHRTRDGIETLSSEEVEHVWLNEFPGFDRGLSPITACRLSLSGAIDVRDFAATWFDRGAVPPGVLTSDQPIDKTTALAQKAWWNEGDAGEIKVMGKGLKFEPILIKPEDAQWIEAQNFSILDMARLFGIPPVMLAAAVAGSSLTYQTLQMIREDLLQNTLGPLYLDPLEASLSTFVPLGQDVRFDASAVTRRDDKTRMETHKLAIDAGIYDADYARNVLEGIAGSAPTRKERAPA